MPSFIVTAEEDYIPSGGDDQVSWWDYQTTTSTIVISAVEEYAISDPSTAVGHAVVSAVVQVTYVAEVSTVTGVAVIQTAFSGQEIFDTAVVASVVVLVAPDLASYLDASAAISSAEIVTLDSRPGVDEATITSIALSSALDRAQSLDTQIAQGVTVATALEVAVFSDLNASQGAAVPSAAQESAAFLDQATTSTIGLSVAQEGYNTGFFYTDANTGTSVAVPTALDGKVYSDASTASSSALALDTESYTSSDVSVVTEFQAISALEIHSYAAEVGTVTSAMVQSLLTGQDTFTRTVADTASGTWGTSDGGYTWANDTLNSTNLVGVNGTQGHVLMSGSKHTVNQILQVPADLQWDITVQAQWDVAPIGAAHSVFLNVRCQSDTHSFYSLRLRMNLDGSIDTTNETNINGTTPFLGTSTVVQAAGGWTAGQLWNLRLQLVGGQLNSKVWPALLAEPGSFTTITNDSSITGSGTIGVGFFTAFGYTGSANFLVDNFTFANLGVAFTDNLAALDSSTTQSVAQPSASFLVPYTDAATVTGDATPSSTDTYAVGYAFFDSFVRNPVSSGWGTPSDTPNPWVVINGTASDFSTTGTVGKIFVSNTAGHEIAITAPAPGGAGSQYNIGQFMQWQWNATNTGTLPVSIGAHLYWVDEVNRTYYRLVVGQKPSGGSLQLSLDKVLSGGTTSGLGGFNIITSTSSLNTYYNLRTEASGLNTSRPTFNARLWLASASEPTAWGFTYTDTSGPYPPLNANYGFRTNIFAGDTNNPTLKFAQYYGYYL